MIAKEAEVHLPDLESGIHQVPYYLFPRLSRHPSLVHAIFTRQGGVSRRPYNSLNIGYGTGDLDEDVQTNIRIMKNALGVGRLRFLRQVHGQHLVVLKGRGGQGPAEVPRGDALITDRTRLALMIKQADCQAVILFDPSNRVVANVHCGWRGNARNILGAAVGRMKEEFGSEPPRLMAAIGPSLGPCCAEFVSHEEIFPKAFRRFMVRKNHFDLWAVSRWQLMEAGLTEQNIELARICTKCRTDLFFSYRAEGITGRFATLVMLT